MIRSITALCLLSLSVQAEPTQQQLEQWFDSDDFDSPEAMLAQDETLRLIADPFDKALLATQKTYTISADSLHTGWVDFDQCYRNLDAVAEAEVVYQYRKLRNLKVTQQHRIGKLWIEGQSIQMQDLSKGASLCSSAQVQLLTATGDNHYVFRSGPYKRKFLDGYYPMAVKLNIQYPAAVLNFSAISPLPAAGFEVKSKTGSISIDARFSGKLFISIDFVGQ